MTVYETARDEVCVGGCLNVHYSAAVVLLATKALFGFYRARVGVTYLQFNNNISIER